MKRNRKQQEEEQEQFNDFQDENIDIQDMQEVFLYLHFLECAPFQNCSEICTCLEI